MVTTVGALLTTVTTTTVAKASISHRVTPLAVAVAVAGFAASYGLAYYRRKKKGNTPWRLPPAVWGIFGFITDGVALILLAIAWFTTNDRLPPRTSRYMRLSQNLPPVPQSATDGDPPQRPAMVPGTYGTSLPPHLESNGKSGDDATRPAVSAANQPAGWRADPTGRHQYRYWSGSAWTKHVSDEGTRSVDPL